MNEDTSKKGLKKGKFTEGDISPDDLLNDEVYIKLKKIIVEQLGVKETEISPGANFADDLGADSLDIVEMIMAVEEEFDIQVSDEEAESLQTVMDVAMFIKNH